VVARACQAKKTDSLMLLDAKNPAEVPDKVYSKVVIIGAGTIGLFMAFNFAKAQIPVIVVEAGGRVADTSRNAQTAASRGKPHNGVRLGRAFGLGGTSVLWGGQLAEFEPADLVRDGFEWPLCFTELRGWYEKVYDLFGMRNRLPTERYREKFGGESEVNGSIERFFAFWLPHPNFATLFRREIKSSPLIKIVVNATVNDITFVDSRAQFVRAAVPGRREIQFFGDNFVFAPGTIEASRFFLSTQRLSSVPWKTNPHIGRHFQDHMGGKIAEVQVLNERRFRNFFENGFAGALKLQPKLRFSEKSRERMLTGVCGFFAFDSEIGENINNIKLLIGGLKSGIEFSKMGTLPSDAKAVVRTFFPLVIRYIRDRRIFAVFDRALEFHVQAEQLPIADSRIKLSGAEPGPDGLFGVELDWQIDGREAAVISAFARQANAYLETKSIARLRIDEKLLQNDFTFLSNLSDTYHQCSGLRMANNEAAGVVDPNCRVWGTTNVFVSGASVFPTSGHANCTLTGLALAARLVSFVTDLK
jgi:choline dehydrogenase-like flavoprotein